MLDVRMLTVGPVQENCYLVRLPGASSALMIDPGDEAPRLLELVEALGVSVEAILLTHTHFDHVGAVAALARATGAPVYCPLLERHMLADINAHVRLPGLGPFESYEADATLSGGEQLELAGIALDVIFTPGHSPGHLSYSAAEHGVLFDGDVLFRGSVGRTDLPGASWEVLLESIAMLLDALPEETLVYPGHMGSTTLAAERATNPFLAELAR